MHRYARSVPILQWLSIGGLAMVGLFLVSCGESSPSSPSTDPLISPELVSRTHQTTAAVELHKGAKLQADGSVQVVLRARCPSGFHVIEGPMTLMQGPEFQEIFGEGFFTTRCDGRWHRQEVRVRAPEGFQRGQARASATLMVENETGEFLQGDDGELLKIR